MFNRYNVVWRKQSQQQAYVNPPPTTIHKNKSPVWFIFQKLKNKYTIRSLRTFNVNIVRKEIILFKIKIMEHS